MAIQSTTAAKASPTPSGKGAQALKTNAKTAKKCAPNNKTGKCGFCERDGYPILPVRYAVLPNYVAATGVKPLSAVPKLDTFDKQPLKANKYTLRTLRKGFVHVYLGTPGVWQSYVVTEDGYLRVLADPDDPDWKTERPLTEACKRAGDNIPASFITIPNGHETVWIAFSENVWNSTVRGRYEKSPAKRMQQFDIKQVASNPDATEHCFEIGPDNKRLHDMVFEYVGQENEYLSRRSYRGGGWDQKGSQATTKNNAWQSLHGNFARAGHSAALTGYAKNVADKRKAMQKPGKIAAFALYDAVGIVKELNGHTHDRIEWRQAYNAAVARPLLISQAIVGLKKQIEASTQAAITEDETKRKIPDKVSEPSYGYDGIGGPVSIETTTRAERIESQQKATWGKLKDSYNEAERSEFERRYSDKMKDFQTEISKCDQDWVTWARADKWKAWLGDYDTEKLLDNVRLMTMCAPALAGGPQGTAGIKLWDEWLSNHKDEANPTGFTMPYAAIMGGRKDLLTALIPKVEKKETPSETARNAELNKGDKLHDSLKAILAAEELKAPDRFKHFMNTKVQAAATHLLAAIEGAASQLQAKTLDAVDTQIKRATQAALRLYSNVSPVCLQVRMTIGQYVDMLNQLSRKSEDAGKKFSEVAGRKVRSALLGGMIAIPNAKVRNTVIEVTIWTMQQAEELKKDIQSAVAKAKGGAIDITGKGASALKIAAATLSREAVQILRPLEQTVSLSLGGAKSLARLLLSNGFRMAAASGEPLLAIGSLFFQGWALRDANKQMDATIGPQGGVEAKLPVVSATLGCLGASSEVLGVGLKTFARTAWFGEKLIKVGGAFGAVSLFVDSVQAAYSGVRAYQQGDTSAAVAYGAAALAFGFGAAVALGSGLSAALTGGALLLGPLGWVLLLTAAGIVALWCAMNLERTPVEIWLDRCYWGKGERKNKWTNAEMNEEVADLNGLVLGLGVEMGFNDDWSEAVTDFDTLKVKLTFANYDAKRSVYEWRVNAIEESGAAVLIMTGSEDPDVRPGPKSIPDKIIDKASRYRNRQGTAQYAQGAYTITQSIEVNTKIFKSAKIEVKYWPDKSDPDGWAEKLMTVND